ncbi:MAG: nucleotidyltransferase family protein [Proteobacteria bacterium]|nr:nucleotidyltransferase family protein [Pseudomonadota bacterium]MBU4470581.1 nucleotidyltransferase family protein [Pseudomonadota bacterium]MCG2751416.1 nucleotidyltransferase family protein [Desulfobacteraceae bacterium]
MGDHHSYIAIKEKLQKQYPLLKKRYQISFLGIFGSYVREEQLPGSDLDLLVSFDDTPGLLKFIEMENYISDFLGVKVDLVMREALKPGIGERILKEVSII